VFILKGVKVFCFHTLLQVLILKVDSGMAGARAQFVALSILLQTIFLGNAGRKGVRRLVGYCMVYYTMWLATVKNCPVLGIGKGRAEISSGIAKGNSKPAALKPKA
jgi:hydrogenase-4 membrane subunit HyfE